MKIEIGLTSFADNSEIFTDKGKTSAISNAQRIRNIIEEIEIADDYGLDVYGLESIIDLIMPFLILLQS